MTKKVVCIRCNAMAQECCTFLDSMLRVNMQCEREEAMFMGVSLMVRFVSPRNSCKSTELLRLLLIKDS